MSSRFAWIPHDLRPVVYRLARADELAGRLGDICLSWSGGDGAGAYDLVHKETVPGYHDLVVHSIRPVPPEAAVLFSEAINHLRAAVDNVVYALVEQAHGALTGVKAAKVQFLIVKDSTKYDAKVRRLATQDQLPQLAPGHPVGDRMRELQPFADGTRVPAVPASVKATAASTDPHPLLLLQSYSNQDKHRSLRLAGARGTFIDHGNPQPLDGFRDIRVGDVFARNPIGAEYEVTSLPGLCVQRPDGGPWISPSYELDQLFRYIADIAIPLLVTGHRMPNGFAPQIPLGDNGWTEDARLASAGTVRAHDRMVANTLKAAQDTDQMEPRLPRVVPVID